MKPHARCALLLLCTLSAQVRGDTLRCGSSLISTGDRAFEVEQACGLPAHRDRVGYSLGGHHRRELIIEEWVYGPDNGMLRILRFEGNRLVSIESRRSRR